jgi:hypothetical protein
MSRSVSSQDIQQLEQLKKRFINWRRTRKAKTPIPRRLWNSAAKMAMQCGLSRTAKALRLNYYDLKKRIDACATAITILRTVEAIWSVTYRLVPSVVMPTGISNVAAVPAPSA